MGSRSSKDKTGSWDQGHPRTKRVMGSRSSKDKTGSWDQGHQRTKWGHGIKVIQGQNGSWDQGHPRTEWVMGSRSSKDKTGSWDQGHPRTKRVMGSRSSKDKTGSWDQGHQRTKRGHGIKVIQGQNGVMESRSSKDKTGSWDQGHQRKEWEHMTVNVSNIELGDLKGLLSRDDQIKGGIQQQWKSKHQAVHDGIIYTDLRHCHPGSHLVRGRQLQENQPAVLVATKDYHHHQTQLVYHKTPYCRYSVWDNDRGTLHL